MRLWVKALMFLAAYSPLWGILWWRHFGANTPIGQIAWAIIFLSVLPVLVLFWFARSRTTKTITLEESSENSSQSLNYIIPYTLAIPQFQYGEFTHIAIMTVVMLTLFTIYANSNLLYVNPILYILGYRMFFVSTSNHSKATVISKDPPKVGRPIGLRKMARELYWSPKYG